MKINLTAWIAFIKSKTNIMGKNQNVEITDASDREEVFVPSEQLEKLIEHYKLEENPAENILVAIQHLECAKKEIERPILELEVIEEKEEGDSFDLDKMTDEEIVEFARVNNLTLNSSLREEMLDEIEKQLTADQKNQE